MLRARGLQPSARLLERVGYAALASFPTCLAVAGQRLAGHRLVHEQVTRLSSVSRPTFLIFGARPLETVRDGTTVGTAVVTALGTVTTGTVIGTAIGWVVVPPLGAVPPQAVVVEPPLHRLPRPARDGYGSCY